MNLRHCCSALIALVMTAGAMTAAEPWHVFQDARNHLLAAGNYAWDSRETVALDGKVPIRRRPPDAAGDTQIDGCIRRQLRRTMLIRGKEVAVLLKTGDVTWTVSNDDHLAELRISKLPCEPSRLLRRALPHEILDFIVTHGTGSGRNRV